MGTKGVGQKIRVKMTKTAAQFGLNPTPRPRILNTEPVPPRALHVILVELRRFHMGFWPRVQY